MIPLRIIESERDGFDEPVVELWRDDDFIGMVFWDGDLAVVQIYSDEDGDVFDLGAAELLRAVELAEAIVTPEEFMMDNGGMVALDRSPDVDEDDDWSQEHPATLALVGEFDPQAAHRNADGEGFFPLDVADEFIRRCDELDLAVVEMEGFDLEGPVLKPRPNLNLTVRVPGVDDWSIFRPAANAMALDTLKDWPTRTTLVIAFVVQQPDGEAFVA
jgi:hypothetical protein